MSYFKKIKNKKPHKFRRQVGISLGNFEKLLQAIEAEIGDARQQKPLSRRGKKSAVLPADRLLLTLFYLRHYPTFEELGERFGICESYACKIYHGMCHMLVKVLKLKNRKALLENPVEAVVIDVTEQPIERPTQGQKAYYSGKKNATLLKPNCWFVGVP